jgi:hypothetical protein
MTTSVERLKVLRRTPRGLRPKRAAFAAFAWSAVLSAPRRSPRRHFAAQGRAAQKVPSLIPRKTQKVSHKRETFKKFSFSTQKSPAGPRPESGKKKRLAQKVPASLAVFSVSTAALLV